MPSRREFLKTASAAALLSSTLRPIFAADPPQISFPGKDGLIVRSSRFLDLEMPVEYMTDWITPVPHFFVRSHMWMPAKLDAASWKLTVSGEVQKPITLTLSDLAALPSAEVVTVVECAGNGRGLQNPKVPGIQWGKGAAGNGRFSGVSLRAVLEKAGLKDSAHHVRFRGLDEPLGDVPAFVRSIPIEKAMSGDALIATQMNGAALLPEHGFPARLVTPGWVGAASCKWVTEITVLEKPAEGNFMKPGYRFPDAPGKPGEPVDPEKTHALTSLPVKSTIALPAEGASLRGKSHTLKGVAWAGEAEITKVEISADGGASWQNAELGKDHAKYAWRLWTYHWKPAKSGEFTLLSRASDSQGRTQPATPIWNPSGYLYNAYDEIKVYVHA